MLIGISTPFPFTAELSTNSLGDLMVFWNYDIQTVFHAVELSTNSLRAFVACWNCDLYIVSIHSRTFNEILRGNVWYFELMISTRRGRANDIDPEGRRNAKHVPSIVVVDLVPHSKQFWLKRTSATATSTFS